MDLEMRDYQKLYECFLAYNGNYKKMVGDALGINSPNDTLKIMRYTTKFIELFDKALYEFEGKHTISELFYLRMRSRSRWGGYSI